MMINNITLTKLNKVTLLYALISILSIVGFAPHLPSVIVYLATALYSVYCLSRMRNIDPLLLVLLIYIPIELLIVQPNDVFIPWPRLIFFTFLLINVSPLLQSRQLRKNRQQLLQLMLWGCVILGVGSFFAYFLGINFMTVGSGDYLLRAGLFGGLTNHSMMLGPIAGIGACYLTSLAISRGKPIYWIWTVFAFLAVLFSASRSAVMAVIAGVAVTIYYNSSSAGKFAKYVVLAIVIGVMALSIFDSALVGIIEKNGSTSELNYDSRADLWTERLHEFYSSPVFGVGFASIGTSASYGLDISSGRIETGSSWLIIFSMLGILGALIVFPILLRAFILARRRKDEYRGILNGVLALFFIHMFAEGYIFAGGSFLAFMLWLTVGVATDSRYQE